MKKILFFSLVLILISCGIFTKPSTKKNTIAVEIKGTAFIPFCGGMEPTKEQGTYEALSNEEYALFTVNDCQMRVKKKMVFTLNELGTAAFSIEPGTYALISTDKLLPLAELKKKYHINDQLHYTNGSDACFELWKSKNDLILNITNDTVISYVQKRKCWTGNNPCLEYTGPAAP
jgi:hypothetical protein